MKAVLFLARAWKLVLPLSTLLALSTVCNASRISGTYVAHGPGFVEMLQLTETGNGQISAVLSSVVLKDDGNVSSEQTPFTGVVDGNQITLSTKSFLFGTSLAGTVTGNTIRLQILDSKGNMSSEAFVLSTPDRFKAYAGEIRSRGDGIRLSAKLLSSAQELRGLIHDAENWIANAELHAGRIPNAKAAYGRIEDQMRSLVEQERATSDPNTRIQISLKVGQGDLAGGQVDLQVDQVWDVTIEGSGTTIKQTFSNWNANCGTAEQLQRRSASPQAIESWLNACKQTIAERAKFDVVYGRIMGKRADLKSFEATAQAHRKALVDEANHIE